jgi:hypothetical protein
VTSAVERAARAQARLLCAQGWTKEECDSFVEARWQHYVSFARAAIASLREPTPAIVEASARATDPDAWKSDGPRWRQPGARLMAALGWRDAIDAALSEPGSGEGG